LTAELVLEWSARQVAIARDGNRDPRFAPQGVYACRADTPIPEWVAITIEATAQWRAFAKAIGRDDWVKDELLADLGGRRRRHDELDAGIAAWTIEHSPAEV